MFLRIIKSLKERAIHPTPKGVGFLAIFDNEEGILERVEYWINDNQLTEAEHCRLVAQQTLLTQIGRKIEVTL